MSNPYTTVSECTFNSTHFPLTPAKMSLFSRNDDIFEDALGASDYSYLAHISLEVPAPTAKPAAVVDFIAGFLVQHRGFIPRRAMRKARRLSMDGAQLYNQSLEKLERVLPINGRGLWTSIHNSSWRAVCTTIPILVYLSNIYS